jgi:hypothetical protein
MEKIRVKKEELLQKLTVNFGKWKKVHRRAMNAYWRTVSSTLRKSRIKAVRKDPTWMSGIVLTPPEDHSDDFETAIRMLRMSCEDEVEVSEEDFNSYVLNRWHWRQGYIARASVYCSSSSSSSRSSSSGSTGVTGPCGPEGAKGEQGLDF